jgi:hypothetical protein
MNAAGTYEVGSFAASPIESFDRQHETNSRAPHLRTQLGYGTGLEVLSAQGEARGRYFSEVEITINPSITIRDSPADALEADARISRNHGLVDDPEAFARLSAWGPRASIAESLRTYVEAGWTRSFTCSEAHSTTKRSIASARFAKPWGANRELGDA